MNWTELSGKLRVYAAQISRTQMLSRLRKYMKSLALLGLDASEPAEIIDLKEFSLPLVPNNRLQILSKHLRYQCFLLLVVGFPFFGFLAMGGLEKSLGQSTPPNAPTKRSEFAIGENPPTSQSSSVPSTSALSNATSLSASKIGSIFDEAAPDYLFIRELNRLGLHAQAQEIALRRRSDIGPITYQGLDRNSIGVERGADSHGLINAISQWAILWMESSAQEQVAAFASQIDNAEGVQSALDKIDEFIQQESLSPRYPWLLQKSAWCKWLLCRSLVAAHLVAPARTNLQVAALEVIRSGLDQLDLVRKLTNESQIAPNAQAVGGVTASEVSSLIIESSLLSCDLLVLRANLYWNRQDEQVACGTQMLSLLEEVDRRISLEFKAVSHVELARCQAWFYSGQYSKVTEIANEFVGPYAKRDAPYAVKVSFAAIASEASRRIDNTGAASQWIEQAGGWESAPQLALESLAIDLMELNDDDQSGLASILQKKEAIGEKFGIYWGQRADAVLIAHRQHNPSTVGDVEPSNLTPDPASGTPNAIPSAISNPLPSASKASLTILRTEAKQLLAAKQYDQAVQKLAQAEAAATQLRLPEEAITFRMQIAALLGLQKKFQQAANAFLQAATTYHETKLAPRAAMNAVTMVQEQLRELQSNASNPQANPSVAEARTQAMELRQEIWESILKFWPFTNQGRSAAFSLSSYYISTDRIWEVAELWTKLWELSKDSSSPRYRPAIHGDAEDTFQGEQFDQEIAKQALECFRLISWLRNQTWLDANILGTNVDERWLSLQQRLNPLTISSKVHSDFFKDCVLLSNGYAWEYPSTSFRLQPHRDRIQLWIDGHSLLPILENARHLNAIQELPKLEGSESDLPSKALESVLERWTEATSKNAGRYSHLETQMDRSAQIWKLAIQVQLGNVDLAISELNRLESVAPKDPWWGYYAARLYQMMPGHEEKALQRYVKIANSLPAGSPGWLECRTRSVQVLSQLGRTAEALKLVNMVTALQSKLPAVWKNRLQAAMTSTPTN